MAILRSIGGRSLMTLLPIMISPEVISSSPASMRKVVVLPQPEGPTSTTNSLSRISSATSFTAWKPFSYFLFSARMLTFAISAFHGSRQAGDVVLDEERINQGDGDRAQQRPGHQLAPEED